MLILLFSCAQEEKSALQKLDHTISEVVVELDKLQVTKNNLGRPLHGSMTSLNRKDTLDVPMDDLVLPAIAVTYVEGN